MTDAIRRFQADACDWSGKPLTVDGVAGPRTAWALAIADLPRWRREVVGWACSQVGVREDPARPNRGVEVDAYLAPTGLIGVPWCAAFVSWVLREAVGETRYTAAAREALSWGWATDDPQPGDLFGWVEPDGHGHVGFVIGRAGGAIATLEGNSADGVRVCARPRDGLVFKCLRVDVTRHLVDVFGVPVVRRALAGTR